MAITKISEANSFKGWEFLKWAEGRKSSIVATVSALIVYFISDQALAAIISGAIVEGLFAIGDYYFTQVKLD